MDMATCSRNVRCQYTIAGQAFILIREQDPCFSEQLIQAFPCGPLQMSLDCLQDAQDFSMCDKLLIKNAELCITHLEMLWISRINPKLLLELIQLLATLLTLD